MTLTINTDASFHPVHKVGAFAFWIICAEGRMIHSGPLKKVSCSQDAELQCIGNALYAVLKSKFKDVQYIVVNTDCKYAIEAITKGKRMKGCVGTVSVIHGIVQELKDKYNISPQRTKTTPGRKRSYISWRYVPAHSDGETKRKWVNNRMDKLAKKALWSLINSKTDQS